MASENFGVLLAGKPISDNSLQELLTPFGFADWKAAGRCLTRLAAQSVHRQAISAFLPHLLASLSSSANPDRALVNFERFTQSSRTLTELFNSLANNPRTVEIMVTLFASSQFLTEILLSNPDFYTLLEDHSRLAQPKSPEDYYLEAQAVRLCYRDYSDQLDALRRYQRLELLRIGTCDLIDLFNLPVVTQQLTNLADGLVRICLRSVSESLQITEEGFAVIAMGKLGGQELNYSSDIDLIFLGKEDKVGYQRLGEKLIEALSKVTTEGFLYRVDMRLRPWGRVGVLVPSMDGYIAYLSQYARLWEMQALLKARFIAGDESLGIEFLRQAYPLILKHPPETLRAEVFAMKQRTEDELRRRDREWGEVKLGIGSIRDIEFIVQYLQLSQGERFPSILTVNTLEGLDRLLSHKLLSVNDYRVLYHGYIFLRTIEHHLQMMHYQQTNQLPSEPSALTHLARRLGFLGPDAGTNFVLRYQQHCSAIRTVFVNEVGNGERQLSDQSHLPAKIADIPHHLLQMHPSYALAFPSEEILKHAELVDRLSDENLIELQAVPLENGQWKVSIVAFDYPGELSLICGLLFVYHLNIEDGKVFTYESPLHPIKGFQFQDSQPKIVDVFTVKPLNGKLDPEIWSRYKTDLADLLRLLHRGKRREARTELAKRIALALPDTAGGRTVLYPIAIEIDNSVSGRYSVLKIEALDTPGFLYELTNALAIHKNNISRVTVGSTGNRVHDMVYITDDKGKKILQPEKLQELKSVIVLIKHFTHLLPHSPNPGSALYHFEEFIEQFINRPNWADELISLERPEILNALAQLLGMSDFLWDDFLRMQYANLFPVLREIDELVFQKSKEQLQEELDEYISTDRKEWRNSVNAFKDRELFRTDMRNILGYTQEFEQFSRELTDLVEVVVDVVYHCCYDELVADFGEPVLENGQVCPLSICALGKCGGHELGYASDIELVFIYAGNGYTTGPRKITVAEFFDKLVENFISAIRSRREGIFQIDLQLRPYGKAGSLAVSLEAFRRYYSPKGPAWAYERQALVKLRPIAGDQQLGNLITLHRDEYVYNGAPFNVTAMRAMRERQIRHFVDGGTFNAKFSPGGLLDVEYLVQGLQITHGARHPSLRSTNIREALAALAAEGIISPDIYSRLRKAHTFLRWLIDSLRVVRGNAKDLTVPSPASDEFAFLARRLHYGADLARLQDELVRFSNDVQEIGRKLFGDPSGAD